MKKEYVSPVIKSEELMTKDVLISSTPDNQNVQYEQNSLLRTMMDFAFGNDD
ncbi:MAG: hypothetical protein VZR54_02570 [Ruminococcus sp.]|nr:hypothetical protein [Ruminococcus sp.]